MTYRSTLCLITTLFMLGLASNSFAQQPEEQSMYFVILYTTGEQWDTTKTAYEQAYFSEHSQHLAELRSSKKLVTGGRYHDTGMIILKAANSEEAEALLERDPALTHGMFKASMYPYAPFYGGCIE